MTPRVTGGARKSPKGAARPRSQGNGSAVDFRAPVSRCEKPCATTPQRRLLARPGARRPRGPLCGPAGRPSPGAITTIRPGRSSPRLQGGARAARSPPASSVQRDRDGRRRGRQASRPTWSGRGPCPDRRRVTVRASATVGGSMNGPASPTSFGRPLARPVGSDAP